MADQACICNCSVCILVEFHSGYILPQYLIHYLSHIMLNETMMTIITKHL